VRDLPAVRARDPAWTSNQGYFNADDGSLALLRVFMGRRNTKVICLSTVDVPGVLWALKSVLATEILFKEYLANFYG